MSRLNITLVLLFIVAEQYVSDVDTSMAIADTNFQILLVAFELFFNPFWNTPMLKV